MVLALDILVSHLSHDAVAAATCSAARTDVLAWVMPYAKSQSAVLEQGANS